SVIDSSVSSARERSAAWAERVIRTVRVSLIVHLSLRTERIDVRTKRSGPFVGPGFSGFFDIATEPEWSQSRPICLQHSIRHCRQKQPQNLRHERLAARNLSGPSYFRAWTVNANTVALRACLSRQDAPRGRRIGKACGLREGARVRML